MNLMKAAFDQARIFPAAAMPAGRPPFAFDAVELRHLKTSAEIESVRHLREEIDLSVHAAAGQQFLALEKKETSAASWSPSTWMGNA